MNRRRMLSGKKRTHSLSRAYTTGELNRTVDALLHPLAEVDPAFPGLDGVIHGLIEQNPPESLGKFVHHNLPDSYRNCCVNEGCKRWPESVSYTVGQMRDKVGDMVKALDLEDGSGTINAKLGTVEVAWTGVQGLECVGYQAAFYETSDFRSFSKRIRRRDRIGEEASFPLANSSVESRRCLHVGVWNQLMLIATILLLNRFPRQSCLCWVDAGEDDAECPYCHVDQEGQVNG